MDMYCADKKLSELGEDEFGDLWDNDMFTPPPSNSNSHSSLDPLDALTSTMDGDWLDNFFDDPVLNDRMISDALQPQHVCQSEHSYSLANGETDENGELIKTEPVDKDIELLGSINPNALTHSGPTPAVTTMTSTINNGTTLTIKTEPIDMDTTQMTVTRRTPITTCRAMESSSTSSHVTHHQPQQHQQQTLLKHPTIILASTTQSITPVQSTVTTVTHMKPERLVLPKVNIKVEPIDRMCTSSPESDTSVYEPIGLPPTPPGSNNSSDSDGSLSPLRSGPSSPIQHIQITRHHDSLYGGHSSHHHHHQALFTSPIPTSGVLILTEEEKRTLISEGYPIPHKLPLTKQEEKNLKKIRRKIKNKISAQESRRKKKEYMENLEKRMEGYSQENCDLKKKVDHLENNNRSLMSQLHKLQALVAKARPSNASTAQTGTCLMVVVLFFAVFLGTWTPLSWSIGYRGLAPSTTAATMATVAISNQNTPMEMTCSGPPMGPHLKDPTVDAYATPNMRSRVLLSIKDELEEDGSRSYRTFSYQDFFSKWLCLGPDTPPADEVEDTIADPMMPGAETIIPKVDMLDVEMENNQTGEDNIHNEKSARARDMTADISANIVNQLKSTS